MEYFELKYPKHIQKLRDECLRIRRAQIKASVQRMLRSARPIPETPAHLRALQEIEADAS